MLKYVKGKKLLSVSTLVLLVICFLLMIVYSPNESIAANANVGNISTLACEEALEKDCEQMIADTREEYKDLKEYSYGTAFDAEMQKRGMTVGESLVEQICYYQEMLCTANDEEEINKINHLIESTKNILDIYQTTAMQSTFGVDSLKYNLAEASMTVQSYATIYALAATAVPAAIAWFNASNYLLSAELLTHAWIENFFPGDYAPIHGNRVVGSQVTYGFVHSSNTKGDAAYPIFSPNVYNTATCYEEDLGFALHGVNFSRSNVESTNINIIDIYDFEVRESYNDVLAALIRVFEIAQSFEIIGNYKVVIDIDVSDALYLELDSTVDNTHSIKVYNLTNNKINLAYNTKMCLPAHAEAFQNITDIEFITIPAKGNETVEISTNGTASHITFCYIKDNYRIVTYADELYQDRSILNTTFEKRPIPANDIAIITKVNTSWLIKLTNNYGAPMRVDYNTKMCNENDAKSWMGLNNIDSFYLNPDEERFIYISENYFATHIAARFVSSNYEYYIYANNLNAYGTMLIGRRTAYI